MNADLFGNATPLPERRKAVRPTFAPVVEPAPLPAPSGPKPIRARRSPWIDAHFKYKPYWYPKGLSEPLVPWDHADIDLS